MTIILAIIIYGLGHIYLGFVRKGVVILIVGFAINIVLSYLFGWWGSLLVLPFWGWQLFDAYKTYRGIYKPKQ